MPTNATTTKTAAPSATGTSGEKSAATPPAAMPTTWKRAPPACDNPLPCSRSFPTNTSGMAADFTASTIRTQACTASNPRISPAVASALPSVVSLPSGPSTATATAAAMPAVISEPHHTTRRRGNRSMNTPMNGDSNV